MISIDNEYERLRFEAWAKDNLGQGYPLTCDEGIYVNAVTRWAFIAWKAGRRELKSTQVDRENVLKRWDEIRSMLLSGDTGTLPREMFEDIIDELENK